MSNRDGQHEQRRRPHAHLHRHPHDQDHRALAIDPAVVATASVHRLGRRGFLAELGRRGFAVAILGGAVAACSDSDDGTDDGAADGASTIERRTSTTGRSETDTTLDGRSETDTTLDGRSDDALAQRLTWTQVSLGFVSAYVLARGNHAAVVDTGTAGSADRIGETLTMLGLTFDDVDHVVLTHHHPDHVGSLPDVMARADDAIAYAGELDIPNIDGADVTAAADGDDVFGLRVIETPGHTPGSISLFDAESGLLVAGDALNGNDDGSAILGPNEQFSADIATANESVAKLAELAVEAAVFGHGQPVPDGAGPLLDALA